jgi:HK97 family phage portal protein
MIDFADLMSDGVGWSERPGEPRGVLGEDSWYVPPNPAGVSVTPSAALRLSAYLSTLNVLATDVAVLPLDVYRRLPGGGREEATDHPVSNLLARSPNRETTPMRWRQALMGHALQHGNGYGEIQRTGRGKPYALHLLEPESTRPVRAPSGELRYQVGNKSATLPATSVLHVAGFGYDGLCGYNFTRFLAQALGLSIAAETSAAGFFANGSVPGGVIERPPGRALSDTGVENILSSWERRHGGAHGRHRVALLEEGMTWKQAGANPEESQLLETRKFQVIDAARPWRVPPHKNGDFSQAHLANIEASNLDYLMTALMGWLTAIEQEFNLKLFTESEWKRGYYVEHNVNALLRGDVRSRFEAYGLALDKGWMSRDEVRRRENMNPIGGEAGGDAYLVQAQMVPLDKAGQGVNIPGSMPVGSPIDATT